MPDIMQGLVKGAIIGVGVIVVGLIFVAAGITGLTGYIGTIATTAVAYVAVDSAEVI